jgi:hypothetical protein
MSQDTQIVSHVDPIFRYFESNDGYILSCPKTDEVVVLAMKRSDYETLIRVYNDKMITNTKTRKGAKEGKVANPTINGFHFIINNSQASRFMRDPGVAKNLYVSNEDFFTRINAPSVRSKGNIAPVQPGNLTAPPQPAITLISSVPTQSFISQQVPVFGAPTDQPLVFPRTLGNNALAAPSESSEQE